MNDWTAGYVADVGYTYGYYLELNPLRAKMAFLNAGLVCPEVGTACELGFGQGMSANLHAAASVTQWHGTDFNPAQAGFAQELAQASGAGAQLLDEAFIDFANRTDLPDFDYIGLHGIWSWISDENRACIVDFVRRKLKVGGVLYISYNTLPGWASFAPMRHLMTQHAEVIGSEGRGIVSRIDEALVFAENLLSKNPAYLRANPLVADRMKTLKGQNRHYLAHEYFNRDWHPMHFATMAEWLEPAKLNYACSASYLDHIAGINLTPEQQTFLSEIPDAMLRESVRDFVVNQQFRRDYWVKGARRLTVLEQNEQMRQQRVILTAHRPDVPLKVVGALGEATMNADSYAPVLDALADHKPKTLGQLEQALAQQLPFAKVLQCIIVLMGAGHVSPVQDDQLASKAKKACDRLNAYLVNKSRGSADINHLASPVIGGGVGISRISQLFLQARTSGKKQPQEWVQHTWQVMSAQKQHIIKEGKTLETEEDNLAELTRQAQVFQEKELPVLKALQIV